MKILGLGSLYTADFDLQEAFGKEQNWYSRNNTYSCFGLPKPSHTLLYLSGSSAVFTLPDGGTVSAPRGSIVYTPKYSQYAVHFSDTHPDSVDSMVAHFQCRDSRGQELLLEEGICVCAYAGETLKSDFQALCRIHKQQVFCPSQAKSVLYGILAAIAAQSYTQEPADRLQGLRKGAMLLESDEEYQRPVSEIARECFMSECYFRRLFRREYGVTPTEYRLGARIERAKRLLAMEQMSVTAVAAQLQFCDVYHFSRVFRQKTGMSPTDWQKQNRRKEKSP